MSRVLALTVRNTDEACGARVKGRTENAPLAMPFKAAYMFGPGFIQPIHGVRSKTVSYRSFYALSKPLLLLLSWALFQMQS